jgi:CheY-like chemotaxis protein
VVEDNRVNQELAMEILKSVGIFARIAADGAEAVKMVAKEKFDAVLMDIHMPNMNGYEATRKIRNNPACASLPIIAMTASVLTNDQEQCAKAGMNGFVAKPVRQEKLFSAIVRYVRPELEPRLTEGSDGGPPLTIEPKAPNLNDTGDQAAEELDIKKTAADLNIDVAVYQKILRTFFNTNVHTLDRVHTAVRLNQWKHLQSLAHGLKGASGNIGADKVRDLAEKIEKFCSRAESNPADKTKINSLTEDLENHFTRLMAQLKKNIQATDTMRPIPPPSEKDMALARPAMETLIEALCTADPFAIADALNGLKQHNPGLSLITVENKINEYDYEEAIELLNRHFEQWRTSHERKTATDINC